MKRVAAFWWLALLAASCADGGECVDGQCVCPTSASCELPCDAPPCHVDCEGDNPSCDGACANGTCTCGSGSSCAFACDAPPCHVTCEGDNPACSGTCANGSCTCGPGSSCSFTCGAGPCHNACQGDCLVNCPSGTAGTQNCDITSCQAGDPVLCPDGVTIVCGLPCP